MASVAVLVTLMGVAAFAAGLYVGGDRGPESRALLRGTREFLFQSEKARGRWHARTEERLMHGLSLESWTTADIEQVVLPGRSGSCSYRLRRIAPGELLFQASCPYGDQVAELAAVLAR